MSKIRSINCGTSQYHRSSIMESTARSRSKAAEAGMTIESTRDRRWSSIFSMFNSSLSKKSSSARSSMALPSSAELSPTDTAFSRGNRKSNGSLLSTSNLHIPGLESNRHVYSPRSSPTYARPPSPSMTRRRQHQHPEPLPPTLYPVPETTACLSQSTRPTQKFLNQMPLSLALRTSTLSIQLPVVRSPTLPQEEKVSKMKLKLFGHKPAPPPSPGTYELDGRSTFALLHGALLRYHSGFGDDLDRDAIPDNTHFMNGSTIICVTDALQGFKWVVEIKTNQKAMRSPLKKSKSVMSIKDRPLDLSKFPWNVQDGIQVWYLIFESPSMMTEWMTVLRASVAELKEREVKGEKSPAKTPKTPKTPTKSPAKNMRSTQSINFGSPTSTISESLPSSPASSTQSLFGTSALSSNRRSIIEPPLRRSTADPPNCLAGNARRRSIVDIAASDNPGRSSLIEPISPTTLEDESQPNLRRRQPSQQDIALDAFRISAYEDDLAAFVPPIVTELPTPEPQEETTTPFTTSTASSETDHLSATVLTPNLSHYVNKHSSIISVQSRLSSVSSGPGTPRSAASPTSSPQ